MSPQPYRIDVPDAAIADLRDRLDRTRWPGEIEDGGWAYGTNLAYLRELCDYWRDGFDWRAQEARLNAMPQFTIGLRWLRAALRPPAGRRARSPAAALQPRLARLDLRGDQDHRPAHRPGGARRRPRRRLHASSRPRCRATASRRCPRTPGFGDAQPHRRPLGRPHGPPGLRPLRRAGRRLGRRHQRPASPTGDAEARRGRAPQHGRRRAAARASAPRSRPRRRPTSRGCAPGTAPRPATRRSRAPSRRRSPTV